MDGWMKGLDSETLESSRTEMPAPGGERLGHSSRAQQACPCLAGCAFGRLPQRNIPPSLAGNTWLQHAPPAPRRLAPAPGPATPEEEGTADGWPSGHVGGCPGRRPLPSSCPSMRYILFLSAQKCQWWGGGGGAPGGPVPPQISHLGLLECVGSASGPMIQHGPDHAGVRRSVIRVTRTRQLGSEDRAGAGSILPPSTRTVLPAASQPGRRGQAADRSSFRSSSQTRGH